MKKPVIQCISSALFGVTLAFTCGTPATANADTTNQIGLTDFDISVPWGAYGYFYDWSVASSDPKGYLAEINFTDPLIDPTNGPIMLRYSFTNTGYMDPITTNSGAGYGTGFGSAVVWGYDPTVFTSLNLEDYILSWDARVEGLKPGQATAWCQMEFRLNSANVSPLPTRVLQKNIGYAPGSNWTHYVYHLDAGSFGGDGTTPEQPTSYTTFTNGVVAGITGIEYNQNQHMPHDQFGFDDDNVIYLDNIKLEVIQAAGPPPPPPPRVPFTVFDYNFDDRNVWWAWPQYPATTTGWSANANQATYSAVWPEAGGVGGSNGFAISMDNTTIATDPPGLPGWAGGNASSGGWCDYSAVTFRKLQRLPIHHRRPGGRLGPRCHQGRRDGAVLFQCS